MIRAALAFAVATAGLVAAAPAGAYVAAGPAWPTEVVTYSDQTPAYSTSADRAARLINRTGAGIRLRRDDEDPDVVFVYRGRPCNGSAYLGYQRRRDNTVWLGRGCSRDLITLTAAHELSHVLGLDHERRRCSRMNPAFDDSGTPSQLQREVAHLLARPPLHHRRPARPTRPLSRLTPRSHHEPHQRPISEETPPSRRDRRRGRPGHRPVRPDLADARRRRSRRNRGRGQLRALARGDRRPVLGRERPDPARHHRAPPGACR